MSSPRRRTPLETRGFGSRSTPTNPVTLLVILLIAGTGLGVLHNRWRAQGKNDPVLGAVRIALYPFLRGGSALQAGFTVNFSSLFRGRALEQENARLRDQVAQLQQENESLRQRAAETDRLRAALNLVRQSQKPPLAAPVIGLLPAPHFDTIIIGRGSRDGVKEKMAIRTAAGLVGQIIDVGPLSSEAMLLTDLNSGAGGLVQRNGKTLGTGIVQGAGRAQPLRMTGLKREADVKPGDVVVSSGLGGVYPPDVPIGVVTRVTTEDARFLKEAEVAPAAPLPGDLREVLILQ